MRHLTCFSNKKLCIADGQILERACAIPNNSEQSLVQTKVHVRIGTRAPISSGHGQGSHGSFKAEESGKLALNTCSHTVVNTAVFKYKDKSFFWSYINKHHYTPQEKA